MTSRVNISFTGAQGDRWQRTSGETAADVTAAQGAAVARGTGAARVVTQRPRPLLNDTRKGNGGGINSIPKYLFWWSDRRGKLRGHGGRVQVDVELIQH